MDRDNILDACYSVARNTMWDRRPVDTADITRVADALAAIAREKKHEVAARDGDPDVVVRAVRYLARAHAIPPMR
jgi:hypothetical protein